MTQDEEHLKLLSVFHYVVAGLAGLFGCFPIIHLVIGIAILVGGSGGFFGDNGPPVFVGLIFVCIAGVIIVCFWALAVCLVVAGGYLRRREHYTFCLIIGAVSCMFMPFGTVLGVFTIVVLMRESVKELFATRKAGRVNSGPQACAGG